MERFDSWDTELYHHGILGQKWGVRRFQNKDGSLTPAGEKRYDSDGGSSGGGKAASAPTYRRKRLGQMNDEELRAEIARLKLERQYKELKRGSASNAVKIGSEIVSKLLDYSTQKRADERAKKEQALREKELAIRFKEANTKAIEAKERTKQMEKTAATAKSVVKQKQAEASKEWAEARKYRTWAKRREAKADIKRARAELKEAGVAKKKISLLRDMFEEESSDFSKAIENYFGGANKNENKNK